MTSEQSPLSALIQREIEARGAIPFARFMELALYTPDLGYYERDNAMIGTKGDFYTSVSVGKLFGELLAFHFAEEVEKSGKRKAESEKQMDPPDVGYTL